MRMLSCTCACTPWWSTIYQVVPLSFRYWEKGDDSRRTAETAPTTRGSLRDREGTRACTRVNSSIYLSNFFFYAHSLYAFCSHLAPDISCPTPCNPMSYISDARALILPYWTGSGGLGRYRYGPLPRRKRKATVLFFSSGV
ncbi:hypothetical protein GGR53DRAFT_33696 [Hypoxylon sp. FL1150]|nr:hypothetical protein GGR53DRAFT_33696 [Hypoxylon sp. FL1150]